MIPHWLVLGIFTFGFSLHVLAQERPTSTSGLTSEASATEGIREATMANLDISFVAAKDDSASLIILVLGNKACGPCQALKKSGLLEKIQRENGGRVRVYHLETPNRGDMDDLNSGQLKVTEQQEYEMRVISKFGYVLATSGFPTLRFFKQGKLLKEEDEWLTGYSKDSTEKEIQKVLDRHLNGSLSQQN